jgi:hypothetical protein
MDAVAYVVPLLAFLGIYAVLHMRARRPGEDTTIQWGWLVIILLCAAAAIVLGNAL